MTIEYFFIRVYPYDLAYIMRPFLISYLYKHIKAADNGKQCIYNG